MKRFVTTLLLLPVGLYLMSQIQYSDSTKKWFIPTHATVQYAGGFGFISAGVGYDLFKDRLSIDIMAGYLPKSIGGISIFSLNSKTIYKPWHIPLFKTDFTFAPINIGFLTMHAFGEQYTKFKKSGDYPQGYYYWPNSTRFGLSLGQNYFYPLKQAKTFTTLEFYWDVSADDLGFGSSLGNKTVKRKHIYTIDFGFKAYF